MADRPQETAVAEPSVGAEGRLESWKEIAAYFKRGVRTVRRWEKEQGLPVRRHLHQRLSTVYSFTSDVDAWWADRRGQLEARPPAPPSRVRLAVLPFLNLSGNPEQEFLSDGFTEELITELAQLPPQQLDVIARTSDPPARAALSERVSDASGTKEIRDPSGYHVTFVTSDGNDARCWVQVIQVQ